MSTTMATLTSALTHWQAFGLSEQRDALDVTGEKIAAAQDTSAKARKTLAAATKAFHKMVATHKAHKATATATATATAADPAAAAAADPGAAVDPADPAAADPGAVSGEQVIGAVPALLRKYQKEIDALTKRARYAEKHFLSMYKDLAEVPDPAPLLELALDGIRAAGAASSASAGADAEIARLKAQLRDNAQEFATLRNQDVTIARLEKEVRELRADMESQVAESVAHTVARLEEEAEAKSALLVEREERLRAQMRAMEDDYAELRGQLSHARSVSLGAAQAVQEADDVRADTIAALTAELGRAKARVMALEAERTAAAAAAAAAAGGSGSGGDGGSGLDMGLSVPSSSRNAAALLEDVTALELELSRKDVEISDLVDEVANVKEAAAEAAAVAAAALAEAKAEAAARAEEVEELMAEVGATPVAELEALRHQVAVLRGQVFGDSEASDTPLDVLLMAKNKEVEGMLARVRRDAAAAEQAAASTRAALAAAGDEAAAKDELIATLEAQLEALSVQLGAAVASGRGTGPSPPTLASENSNPSMSNSNNNMEEASLVAALLPAHRGGAAPGSPGSRAAATVKSDPFAVVAAQRDRFKARVLELEAENTVLHERVHKANAAAEALRADNLELYEKIRYLESYDDLARERDHGVLMESGAAGGGARSGPGAAGGSAEVRYRKLYEDSINPFTLFHKRQVHSQYNELNAAEKVTLNTSRILLGTKFARTFIFFYSLALHVLVFFVLYKLSSGAAECSQGAATPATYRPSAGGAAALAEAAASSASSAASAASSAASAYLSG